LETLADGLDETKYKALSKFYYALTFYLGDTVLFFKESQAALQIAKKSKCPECVALNYLAMGLKYRNLKHYAQASALYGKGIAELRELPNDHLKEIMFNLHVSMVTSLHYQGKYADALSHGLDAMRLAEMLHRTTLNQKAYNSLSAVYGELYSPDNNLGTVGDRARYKLLAKKYMIKTYEGSLLLTNKKTSAVAAYNLGLFFNEEKQLDSATYFLDKAIELGKEVDFLELLSNAYNVKGTDQAELKPDTALYYFNKAIAVAKQAGFFGNQATAMISKASILAKKGNQPEAMELAEQALELSVKAETLATTLNAYKLLAELSEQSGNATMAYSYFKKHIAIKDSLVGQENFSKIEELEARYNSELKDNEIRNLSQTTSIQALQIRERNVTLVLLVLVVLLVACGVWLFIRQRNMANQQKQIALENRFLRFQLNPHFLSNALVSIQRFMLDNNTDSAADYLTRFARMMRQFLEYSRRDTIAIEHEIEVLKNYVSIQQLGFVKGFTFNLTIDEDLDMAADKIPPMFAQPFIENSIEHGIRGMSNGILTVRLLKREAFLLLSVEDNGAGMISSKSKSTDHVSLASTIIRERMELLNRGRKEKIRLLISTPETGIGTLVQLWLPIYS
jgi:tetratricopeptide (TPR) repeat protein